MSKPKQMEKLATLPDRPFEPVSKPGPAGEMPHEHWDAVLRDPRGQAPTGMSEIPRHVLRVWCRRCDRTVEVQTTDAIRLHGKHAIWKDVGKKLLDNTCQQRTGRLEEDGCWPAYENR